jgi:hypothetical protein
MFVAPFANWRRVSVREHRKKRDWAEEMEQLVMHDFKDANKVTIVLDNFSIVFLGRTPREHFTNGFTRSIAGKLFDAASLFIRRFMAVG